MPGEACLICAYNDPDGFERFKEQQNSLTDQSQTEKGEEGSDDEKETAGGSSIVAIDQSAMTGESLAVRPSLRYLAVLRSRH